MSWLFSQALVAECSADTSLDGEPSAQLNVMPTPHKFWRNDKTMEPSDLSRFGLTSRLLTEGRGAELLTSYLAGFPARTSAQPEPEPELTASAADCGRTWLASFAKYDPAECSWKTAQCSLLGDSEEFLETWPRWGSMRSGASYLRRIPVLPICESASGLWPTPTTPNGGRAMSAEMALNGGYTVAGVKRQIGLESAVKYWPTPRANDAEKRGNFDASNPRNGLPAAAKLWPTPTATLADKGGQVTPRKGREGGTLIEAISARMWPTPTAGSSHSGGTLQEWGGSKNWVRQEDPGLASGQLNPEWVEWLMGWPIGWTELKPLAMDKFREWLRQHSPFSQMNKETAA